MKRSVIHLKAILAGTMLLFLANGAHGAEPFSYDGYYKSFFVAYDMPDYWVGDNLSDEPMLGAVSNRLRLNGHWKISKRVLFDATYNIAPRIQDQALFDTDPFLLGTNPLSYRVTDFEQRLFPEKGERVGSFAVFQNLDRAFVSITAESFDLYIGRQPIAWGSARAVNPTDIIAPFTYFELDTEDRIGVDAVRVRVPMGFMGEIDVGYVFGDDFEFDQSAFFLRGKFYAARNDISLMAVGFRENLLLGFDLARSIGGAGFWTEAGFVIADAFDSGSDSDGEDYFRGTVGIDYNFAGDIYGFVEYHYNGAGKNDAADYIGNLSHTAFVDGATYLMGKHYLAPGFTRQLTPLINARGGILVNLGDPSALLATSLEYNIAENIYLEAGSFIGVGSRPAWIPGQVFTFSPDLDSEFGSYSDTYYTSFRVYF